MPEKIMLVFNEVGKKPPSFNDASVIANGILESGYKFDYGTLYYNYFKNVVSYKTSRIPLFSLDAINQAEKLPFYDSLDEELLTCYNEYALVSQLYYAFKESATSEQSSRMTAMEGATKNAGEMIDKLTLTYNRTRQAVITRELTEIISGAAAL